MCAYFVRTLSLNDKHSCQLFRIILRGKNTPTLTTPLIRANISCAVYYHPLQSCFSFFIHLRGQLEPFGSCVILQSCSSIFHGLPELFASDHLLQSWVSLQVIVVTMLQSLESGQVLLLVVFCFLNFVSYPQLSLLYSSVSEYH